MSSQYPKPIAFSTESLDRRALRHIPNPNGLVLTAGNDELVFRMEKRRGHIVEMTSASVNFPSPRLAHSPKFYLTVVTGRDDQWPCRMENGPVDTTIMALKHVFDGGEVVQFKSSRRGAGRVFP